MFKFLVIGRSLHGIVLFRYWLRNDATLWDVCADLQRECGVAMIDVYPLGEQEQEQKTA